MQPNVMPNLGSELPATSLKTTGCFGSSIRLDRPLRAKIVPGQSKPNIMSIATCHAVHISKSRS